MIPDIPYRFSVRTLPAEDGGGYWVEFADIKGVYGDGDTDRGGDHRRPRGSGSLP